MPKYLLEVRYSAEAVKGVMREGGTARREAAAKSIASVGGKLEAFYFAFGDVDAYVICDVPSEASAIASSMTVNQTGLMRVKYTVLVEPETVDAATKVATSFRPPGQ